MRTYTRSCESDDDFARLTLYYIRHRSAFDIGFSLHDALGHLLQSFQHSRFMLVEDEAGELYGWGHYHYPDDESAFVDSVYLADAHRSTRSFVERFRDMINQIYEENGNVRWIRFHALKENAYLNRLYPKFASKIGEHEGATGLENIYSAEIGPLLAYLNRLCKEHLKGGDTNGPKARCR